MTTLEPGLMPRNNAALSDIYHNMAASYGYIGKRVLMRTYDKMAIMIRQLKEDITEHVQPGHFIQKRNITEAIRKDIKEFLATGTLQKYIYLSKNIPVDLLEVMEIKGFGPGILRMLHEEMKIDSLEELRTIIASGKFMKIKGISTNKIENLRRSLKMYKTKGSRLLLWDAMSQGDEVIRILRLLPEVEGVGLAGSLRRGAEMVGDIDIVLSVQERNRQKLLNHFIGIPQIRSIVASGWNRISAVLYNDTQIDIRIADEWCYGSVLLHYTGSGDHLLLLKDRAVKMGYLLTENGLFDAVTGTYTGGRTETEIYGRLGLAYIPPEIREGGREIFRASQNILPSLLSFDEMKGDMHVYTNGKRDADTEAIADYVLNALPHYEYVVIANHLSAAECMKQFDEIDRVNNKIGFPFLKKGMEVNILPDGSPEFPDELLIRADWVTAIIDSGNGKNDIERLLKICEHAYVDCISNPGIRIVGQKERERQEWNSLLEKAALTGTALEINAQPRKSDFYDDIVRKAVEKGVLIVIGSCARSLRQYEYMQMGVMKARRGWGSVENVLNAQHWDQIKAIRKSERISKDNTGLKTDHYKKNIADIDGVDATDSVRKQNK